MSFRDIVSTHMIVIRDSGGEQNLIQNQVKIWITKAAPRDPQTHRMSGHCISQTISHAHELHLA